MTVVYRYSGEYTKRIEAGVSFDISAELLNVSQWQLTGKATSILDGIVYLVIAIPLFDYTLPIGDIPSYLASTYYPLDISGRSPGNRWEFRNNDQIFSFRTYGEFENSRHFKPTEGQAISVTAQGILYEWRERYEYRYTGEKIYVFPDPPFDFFWYPANGTKVWNFRVFDANGIQIFSRIELDQPSTVYVIEETCPPNTCPVDCGDHICCYGSDGIATYSYLK